MDKKRFNEIETAVAALSFAEIQKLSNFWKHLTTSGISLSELEDYVLDVVEAPGEDPRDPAELRSLEGWPKCPRHPEESLILYLVPEAENREGFKNRWLCQHGINDPDPTALCGFEVLDKRSGSEIAFEHKRTGKVILPEAT